MHTQLLSLLPTQAFGPEASLFYLPMAALKTIPIQRGFQQLFYIFTIFMGIFWQGWAGPLSMGCHLRTLGKAGL